MFCWCRDLSYEMLLINFKPDRMVVRFCLGLTKIHSSVWFPSWCPAIFSSSASASPLHSWRGEQQDGSSLSLSHTHTLNHSWQKSCRTINAWTVTYDDVTAPRLMTPLSRVMWTAGRSSGCRCQRLQKRAINHEVSCGNDRDLIAQHLLPRYDAGLCQKVYQKGNVLSLQSSPAPPNGIQVVADA